MTSKGKAKRIRKGGYDVMAFKEEVLLATGALAKATQSSKNVQPICCASKRRLPLGSRKTRKRWQEKPGTVEKRARIGDLPLGIIRAPMRRRGKVMARLCRRQQQRVTCSRDGRKSKKGKGQVNKRESWRADCSYGQRRCPDFRVATKYYYASTTQDDGNEIARGKHSI